MVKKAGIKDVARAADVSVGTVSHFLNGRFVSEKRATRIRQAIAELGFTGSLLAKGMRSQKSSVIGLCVPYTNFTNYSELIDALDILVSEANYEMMLVLSRQDPERELLRMQKLISFKVEGVLLVPGLKPKAMLDILHGNGVPTVILSRPVADETRFDQVAVDHEGAMRSVTQTLIRKGRRRLLYIVRFPNLLVTRARLKVLEGVIAESGADVEWEMATLPDDAAEFATEFDRVVSGKDRPDAIIVSNDVMAGWAIEGLRRNGLSWQDDISIVSLHRPNWAEVIVPKFASVSQPTQMLAQTGWACLVERMERRAAPAKSILLEAVVDLESLDSPA